MSNLSDFIIENGVLTQYVGPGGDVVIPEGVTKIGNSVFAYTDVRSIVIPEGVTEIGMGAFSGLALCNITLPHSLTRIGAHAFGLCFCLTKIVIPERVVSIGSKAFNHCTKLKTVIVGDSVISIGSDAFKDTLWLREQEEPVVYAGKVLLTAMTTGATYTISNETIGIAANAFKNCKNLREVHIPHSVKSIGSNAFSGCSGLETVYIQGTPDLGKTCFPESAIVIAEQISFDSIKEKNLRHQIFLGTFFLEDTACVVEPSAAKYFSKNFERIVSDIQNIPELIKRVLQKQLLNPIHVSTLLEQFKGNPQICAMLLEYNKQHFSEAQIQKYIQAQENSQFKAPTAAELKKIWKPVALPEGSLEVSGYFGTETVVIVPAMIGKKQVTKIGSNCFYVDTMSKSIQKEITMISLPDTVTQIGDRAFVNCESLIQIDIPSAVNHIGEYAFWQCRQLTIHAPAGSYAETYAKENNIPFVPEG